MINMKVAIKALVAGAVGAIFLIVANGLNYLIQDLVLRVGGFGYGMSSTLSAWGDFLMYPLSVIIGFAVGALVIWLIRTELKSFKTMVLVPAIAGVTLGGLCLVARIGYELVIRPVLTGYTVNPTNALITVLVSCTDVLMMTGLVVAGAAICAAFVTKTEIK